MSTVTVSSFWEMSVWIFAIVTIIPVLYRAIRTNLPSARLHALIVALEELDGLYHHSLESGFMSDLAATAIRGQVLALHARADAHRFRAMKATTFVAELRNLFRGLSSEISQTIRDVKALRGKVSAMSLDELEAQRRQHVLYCHCNCDMKIMRTVLPCQHVPANAMVESIDALQTPAVRKEGILTTAT